MLLIKSNDSHENYTLFLPNVESFFQNFIAKLKDFIGPCNFGFILHLA